jgi:hypothetical protein
MWQVKTVLVGFFEFFAVFTTKIREEPVFGPKIHPKTEIDKIN